MLWYKTLEKPEILTISVFYNVARMSGGMLNA